MGLSDSLGGYGVGAALPIRGFALGWMLLITSLMSVLMWLISRWRTDESFGNSPAFAFAL